MFILTEKTPNPDALKFIPHVRLTAGAALAFRPGDEARASPLARRMFGLPDVVEVLITPDFVTVRRRPDGEAWATLRIKVIAALADHLESGEFAAPGTTEGAEAGDPIENEIRQVLGLHVRPGAVRDGGDILFESFDPASGVLRIRMEGACGGCPSAKLTLKAGVEQVVRRFVPEVLRVEEAAPSVEAAEPSRLRRWASTLAKGAKGAATARTVFAHNGVALPDRS